MGLPHELLPRCIDALPCCTQRYVPAHTDSVIIDYFSYKRNIYCDSVCEPSYGGSVWPVYGL